MTTVLVVSIVFAPILGVWIGFAALVFDLTRHLLDDFVDNKEEHVVFLKDERDAEYRKFLGRRNRRKARLNRKRRGYE
jgi:phosphate/sulfate permease